MPCLTSPHATAAAWAPRKKGTQIRIIAGMARGRRLVTPKGLSTRPTRERVRESLFSILQGRVEGARVLDLFAGSGALGLEALSRGARLAVFVERSPQAIAALRENLAHLGVAGGTILAEDVMGFITRSHGPAGFDLVFADPPYAGGGGRRLLDEGRWEHLLAPHGMLVLESEEEMAPGGSLERTDVRHYGRTYINFFRRRQD